MFVALAGLYLAWSLLPEQVLQAAGLTYYPSKCVGCGWEAGGVNL